MTYLGLRKGSSMLNSDCRTDRIETLYTFSGFQSADKLYTPISQDFSNQAAFAANGWGVFLTAKGTEDAQRPQSNYNAGKKLLNHLPTTFPAKICLILLPVNLIACHIPAAWYQPTSERGSFWHL